MFNSESLEKNTSTDALTPPFTQQAVLPVNRFTLHFGSRLWELEFLQVTPLENGVHYVGDRLSRRCEQRLLPTIAVGLTSKGLHRKQQVGLRGFLNWRTNFLMKSSFNKTANRIKTLPPEYYPHLAAHVHFCTRALYA